MKTQKTKTILFALLSSTLFSCSADVLNKDATSPDQAEEYELTREWQRVIRYNCNNQVVSDQIETVRSPNKYVSIVPDTTRDLYGIEVANRTNNTWISNSGYAFTIDMAPTVLNLKVEDGINQLIYKFKYCYNWKYDEFGRKTAECLSSPVVEEEGLLYIKVKYEQKWLNGFTEYKPSVEECKPKQP